MTTTPSGPTFPGSDINGDSFVDIFWRDTTEGQVSLWTMRNATQIGDPLSLPAMASQWNMVGAADFTGDGVTDLLWHNTRSGALSVWEMNPQGSRVSSIALPTAGAGIRPVGLGDFNKDGKTDILVYNSNNQEWRTWNMNGTTRVSTSLVTTRAAEWQVGAVADFNRDGRDDLAWINQTTGSIEIWEMNGRTQVGAAKTVGTAALGWQLRGSGDFDNNGQNDLLLWNPNTGRTTAWFMNGSTRVRTAVLANQGTQWQPMAQARGGLPDLTVQNLTGLPAGLMDGEQATLRFNVTNQGSRTSVSSTFRYYLSNDATLSPSTDRLLGTITVGALRAGQSATFSRNLLYDASLMGPSSTKTLFLVADAAGVVPESQEGNNVLSQSFNVIPTPTPVPPTLPGSDINGDGHTDIVWRNATEGQAALWTMRNGTQINERSLPTLGSQWNLVGSADFTGDGVADLLWHNTNSGALSVWEMNTQGGRVRAISIQSAALNLRPVGLGDFNKDGRTDILMYNTTNQEWRSWNMNGIKRVSTSLITTRPEAWQVGAVADFTGDGKDDLVWMNQTTGSIEIWEMDGRNQVGAAITVGTALGWQLRGSGDFNNDGQNDLLQWNPATGRTRAWLMNGTSQVSSTVLADRVTEWQPLAQARGGLPDLTVPNVTGLPATLTNGDTATISFSVANQGTKTAGASTFRYYLSNDTTVSGNDQFLGKIEVNALRAGQSASFNRTFTYNANVMGDSGTKHLLLVADADGAVTESQENNNVLSRSFDVTSSVPTDVDLVLRNPILPDAWVAGLPVSITLTVANEGTETAGSNLVRIFLLDTPTFNPNGRVVASGRFDSLDGGTAETKTFDFTYLETFGIGQKYLFIEVDSAKEVSEAGSGELNNLTSFAINVAPALNVDYEITNITAPLGSTFPDIVTGQRVSLTVEVTNKGTTVAAPTDLSVYTANFGANNNLFDLATARPVTSAPVSRLEAGDTTLITLGFTYTADFGEGIQNLFFVLDVNDDVEEANEGNNVQTEVITVTPPQNINLEVLNPTLSSTTVLPGQTIDLSAQVQNRGTVSSGTSTWLRAYLSNDILLDANDLRIGGKLISPLSGGASTAVQTFDPFTYNGPAGTYYILFVADDDNAVFETDEDNVSFVQFTVPAVQPGIDLLVSSANSSLSSVTVGEQVTVTATVQNQGAVASGTNRLGFYLSDDNIWDAGDLFINSRSVGSLGTFETSAAQSLSFTYLDAYGIGNKFILAVADDNRLVTESNENNNVRAISLSALPDPNRPDLVPSRIEIEGESSAQNGIDLRYYVQNVGVRPTNSGSVTTAFYLSNQAITSLSALNAALTAGTAVSLGSNTINDDIAVGSEVTALTALFPVQSPIWTAGQKFLIVVTDPTNAVLESNEANNIGSFAITLS